MKTDWGEVLDGEIMRAAVNPADGMPTCTTLPALSMQRAIHKEPSVY